MMKIRSLDPRGEIAAGRHRETYHGISELYNELYVCVFTYVYIYIFKLYYIDM